MNEYYDKEGAKEINGEHLIKIFPSNIWQIDKIPYVV